MEGGRNFVVAIGNQMQAVTEPVLDFFPRLAGLAVLQLLRQGYWQHLFAFGQAGEDFTLVRGNRLANAHKATIRLSVLQYPYQVELAHLYHAICGY